MSRRGGWGDDGDEASLGEEEAELLAKELQAIEDHTVLLIDARPPMLRPDPNEGGRCPLASSLEAAQAVLRRVIMQSGSGARNKVGVMLFGAEQAEAEDEHEDEEEGKTEGAAASSAYAAVGGQHFFLQPLAPPTATRIGELGKLCKDGVDLAAELRLRWPEAQQGTGGGGALHKALRTCLRTLESGARKVDRDAKRIWLFTNEDDPTAASAGGAGVDAAEPTRQGIKDALDSRAEVRLYYFPMPEGEKGFREFDVDRFYGPLLAKQALGQAEWEGEGEWDDEDEDADDAKLVEATAGGVARLKEEAGKRAFRKRRYARMGLHLAPVEAEEVEEDGEEGKGGLTLAVALYKTVQPAKKPTAVQLAAETNRPLESSTRYLSDALVKYVDVELEARRTLDFAGTALDWDKAQYDAVKRAGRGEVGIHLLGFVPAADLAWELSVGGPTLLYPEESVLKGCTRTFIAIREAMLKRGVMALVRFHATARSGPRMAVLLAHPDSPGLELVKLPFLDDVRPVVVATADANAPVPQPSAETVAAAARVVQAVLPKEGFNPEALANPALRKFFTVLEALALEAEGREWDEEAEDATFVQWEKDDKAREKLEQVAPALSAWTAACFEDGGGYEVGPAAKGSKGKGKAAAGGGGGKKVAGASKKRKAAKDEKEEEEGGGDDGEGSLGSAGSGSKKKCKKPAAKKARPSASADLDDGEEDEWGDKVGGGGAGMSDEIDTESAVRELLESGGIHKLKVAELKEYCKKLGVGVSGRKGDLVDRLKQALEEF